MISQPVPTADDAEKLNLTSRNLKFQRDAASYIAEMLMQLRRIAEESGLTKAVKAIDAAYYEAYLEVDGEIQAKGPRRAVP